MSRNGASVLSRVTEEGRAAARTAAFFLKVLPMLPSRPVNWVTDAPVRERVSFATSFGKGAGDLYRPPSAGPHPGIVICLGVVPFGFEHPQVPRLGEAMARSGFAALLYRSPTMEDYRLEPEDVGNVAAAFEYLTAQPFVRRELSGLFGTCVGGSFTLLAAAHPAIRDQVAFVGAFAPYASMYDLTQQIASATRLYAGTAEPWQVDPLTRKVFVHSLTSMLDDDEATLLRGLFDEQSDAVEVEGLSPQAEAVRALLTAPRPDEAREALNHLPPALLDRMTAISPVWRLQDIHAPLISVGHDRDDLVVPVGESRRLRDALAANPGLHYTEFGLFQHADPTKRKLSPLRLAIELGKFYRYVFPMFATAATAPNREHRGVGSMDPRM